MTRYVYGHNYKPPSNIVRNLLIGIAAMIVVVTFVWKTYDPQTFRLLGGVQPAAAEKIQPAAEPPRIDAKQKRLPNG
jgi:hypothetical protein